MGETRTCTSDSVALLRDAVRVLRETASKATPGPWAATESSGCWGVDGAPEDGHLVADMYYCGAEIGDAHAGRPAADAAWIALASPAIAEPLAAVLEFWAETIEKATDSWGDFHPNSFGRELALARAIVEAGWTPWLSGRVTSGSR